MKFKTLFAGVLCAALLVSTAACAPSEIISDEPVTGYAIGTYTLNFSELPFGGTSDYFANAVPEAYAVEEGCIGIYKTGGDAADIYIYRLPLREVCTDDQPTALEDATNTFAERYSHGGYFSWRVREASENFPAYGYFTNTNLQAEGLYPFWYDQVFVDGDEAVLFAYNVPCEEIPIGDTGYALWLPKGGVVSEKDGKTYCTYPKNIPVADARIDFYDNWSAEEWKAANTQLYADAGVTDEQIDAWAEGGITAAEELTYLQKIMNIRSGGVDKLGDLDYLFGGYDTTKDGEARYCTLYKVMLSGGKVLEFRFYDTADHAYRSAHALLQTLHTVTK